MFWLKLVSKVQSDLKKKQLIKMQKNTSNLFLNCWSRFALSIVSSQLPHHFLYAADALVSAQIKRGSKRIKLSRKSLKWGSFSAPPPHCLTHRDRRLTCSSQDQLWVPDLFHLALTAHFWFKSRLDLTWPVHMLFRLPGVDMLKKNQSRRGSSSGSILHLILYSMYSIVYSECLFVKVLVYYI